MFSICNPLRFRFFVYRKSTTCAMGFINDWGKKIERYRIINNDVKILLINDPKSNMIEILTEKPAVIRFCDEIYGGWFGVDDGYTDDVIVFNRNSKKYYKLLNIY